MNNTQRIIKILAVTLAIFIITSIVNGMFYVSSFFYDNTTPNTNLVDYFNSFEKVDNIDIDLTTAKLTIEKGKIFEIKAFNVNKNFKVKYENNNLRISEKSKWFFNPKNSANITLYVPDSYILDELKIDSGINRVSIDNIQATYFKVNQGVGNLEIANSSFENIDIKGGIGEIDITSSILNNLDIDSGIGDMNIEANIAGDNKISCGIGKIELFINGKKEDYQIHVDKGLGDISINNEKQTDNSVYGLGQNKIKVNGGIGEISISFNN